MVLDDSSECKNQKIGFEIQDMTFGNVLGFQVWDVGHEIQGLGFRDKGGVCGLDLRFKVEG